MKKMLVTGGTVFVSRYAAGYFSVRGWDVHVLNRNTRTQSAGVTLIEADRRNLGNTLRNTHFDAVVDITAYTAADVSCLLDSGVQFDDYILLSSSAVYPEYTPQPFGEDAPTGENAVWGRYGTDKIGAERVVRERIPHGYIVRPPYLYGPMNNVYREAFVFDCAMAGREFYIPRDGELKLQFFHVDDLCRFMEILLCRHPEERIFNVGNPEAVSAYRWVQLCYLAAGFEPKLVCVHEDIEQRMYFSFYDYEYMLSTERQQQLMPDVIPLEEGLRTAFEWYVANRECVVRKPLMEFIDSNIKKPQ